MTAPGGTLADIITWVRRIVKPDSDQQLSDSRIIEYINRFMQYDMPERIQQWAFKRQFHIDTQPNTNYYQFPFTDYQIIANSVFVDGTQMNYFQSNTEFYRSYPEQINNQQPIQGDGTMGQYTTTLDGIPIMKSFTDASGYRIANLIISSQRSDTGEYQYIIDDPSTLSNNVANLIQVDNLFQTIQQDMRGTVNYITGTLAFTFVSNVTNGSDINIQSIPYTTGRPTGILFTNNYIKTYPVPDKPYRLTFEAQITPQLFLDPADSTNENPINTSQNVIFPFMSEYIGRGAARKILSDEADMDQLQYYEPFFKEQENLIMRRTYRQEETQRTATIFSSAAFGNFNNNFWWY